jgi:TPR repeat protein
MKLMAFRRLASPPIAALCFSLLFLLTNFSPVAIFQSSNALAENGDLGLLRARAEAGEAAAQFELARKLAPDESADASLQKEAFDWLTKAAELDYPEAQYYLAKAYEEGLGAEPDQGQVFRWLSKAADNGHLESAYIIGYALATGEFGDEYVDTDEARGLSLLFGAAERGHCRAAIALGDSYVMPAPVSVKEVERLLVKAAGKDCPEALFKVGTELLARSLQSGSNSQEDAANGALMLERAGELGEPPAMHLLGTLYSTGAPGFAANGQKAVEWLSKAQEAGFESGYELASIYKEGRVVKADLAKAASLMEGAAVRGREEAKFEIASMYAQGLGVAKDPEAAAQWLERAALEGNPATWCRVAIAYEELGSDAEAADWLAKAAEAGDSEAQYRLGQALAQGRGVDKDEAKAREWLEKSAGSGNEEAKEFLKTLGAS